MIGFEYLGIIFSIILLMILIVSIYHFIDEKYINKSKKLTAYEELEKLAEYYHYRARFYSNELQKRWRNLK